MAIVIGESERIHAVIPLDGQPRRDGSQNGAAGLAAELATRIGGKSVTTSSAGDPTPFSKIAPGQLAIAPPTSLNALADANLPAGAAVVMVLNPAKTPPDDDHPLFSIPDAKT